VNAPEPIETEVARSMLDQLLEDSRLYRKGADYKNLLDFAVRLRNFAPFNALLLQIQKPGFTTRHRRVTGERNSVEPSMTALDHC
jgi:hypothetical protein